MVYSLLLILPEHSLHGSQLVSEKTNLPMISINDILMPQLPTTQGENPSSRTSQTPAGVGNQQQLLFCGNYYKSVV